MWSEVRNNSFRWIQARYAEMPAPGSSKHNNFQEGLPITPDLIPVDHT